MGGPYAPYAELCQRIRDHCAAQGWYGSDAESDWPISTSERQQWYYADGTGFEVFVGMPTDGFKCPPATGQQIRETEEQLGFVLPPALRAIYATVANGGFGPGYGLIGVSSGAQGGAIVLGRHNTTLASGIKPGTWRLSAAVASTLEQNSQGHLECDDVPDGLAGLCDWGCGIASVLDRWTGRVYGVAASPSMDWDGTRFDAYKAIFSLQFQATTIEDWFDRWLCGTLQQPFSHTAMERRLAEYDMPQATSPFDDPDFLEWYASRGDDPAS